VSATPERTVDLVARLGWEKGQMRRRAEALEEENEQLRRAVARMDARVSSLLAIAESQEAQIRMLVAMNGMAAAPGTAAANG
jgi:hypothetical protein